MEGLEYGTTTMVIALEHWKKVRFPFMHGLNVDIYAKNTALRYLLQNHTLLLLSRKQTVLVTIHSNFLKLIAYLKN